MGHARSPARILASIALLLAAGTLVSAPADAGARPPRCFGKVATIVGDGRPNRLVGTGGSDVIVAGGGNDIVIGLGGADLLCGGAGSDELLGGGGNDKLDGQSGSDFLAGAGGNDLMVGGKGARDLVLFRGGPKAVAVDLATGTARGGAATESRVSRT